MKTSAIFVALGATLAAAQLAEISNLSDCVKGCVGEHFTAATAKCPITDVGCICKLEEFVDNITDCVVKACDRKQQEEALAFAKGICLEVGKVTITKELPPPAGATTTPATETTPPPTTPTDDADADEEDEPTAPGNGTTPTPSAGADEPDSAAGKFVMSGFALAGAALAAVFAL